MFNSKIVMPLTVLSAETLKNNKKKIKEYCANTATGEEIKIKLIMKNN